MELIVQIADGALKGKVVNGIASFKDIPYAAAPVGDFRWREPQPVRPWYGYRDATRFRGDSIQPQRKPEKLRAPPPEDCLFLSIWKPADIRAGASLPVMAWLHGGGSSALICDGAAFAARGIVVVSINYRRGRFGFFIHPALIAAAEGPVGNYGYMDQVKALEWVRDNVNAFGGDPNRVTLVGESIGAGSVIHLLTSPAVNNLFQQVMVMSGGGREAILSRPMSPGSSRELSAVSIDAGFAIANGIIGHGRNTLAALRALTPKVLAGNENLEALTRAKLFGDPLSGTPIIDGTIVVGQPEDHFISGDLKHMPIIIGSTAKDVPLHFPPSKVDPLGWFNDEEAEARAAYDVPDRRPLHPESIVKLLLKIGADMTMHEPAHFVASSMREASKPAWVYRFTYTAESTRPEHLRQSHGGELPFMFNTLNSRYGNGVTENDRMTAITFNTYVANFIKTGNPNGGELPDWPQVVPAEYSLMNFSLDDGPVFGPDPRRGVELVARARKAHSKRGSFVRIARK